MDAMFHCSLINTFSNDNIYFKKETIIIKYGEKNIKKM